MIPEVILAPLGTHVQGFSTTRLGGSSEGTFKGLNLGSHSGDSRRVVEANRQALREAQGLPAEALWLNQVHGNRVVQAEGVLLGEEPSADGAVTWTADFPLVVVTADCLPVLCTDVAGTVVGAFHAGWKGLVNGILENGISAMGVDGSQIKAWIGPAISQKAYQVGDDVRQVFSDKVPGAQSYFLPDGHGKWLLDLPGVAVKLLKDLGVGEVANSNLCTFSDPQKFYSFRRENPCGRMGSFISLKSRSQGV